MWLFFLSDKTIYELDERDFYYIFTKRNSRK